MADWQQHLQSVFFGVVFSFLLAKLFSVIFAFREENLRITRSHTPEPEPEPEPGVVGENEPLIDIDVRLGNRIAAEINDHSDSDDDWEGVESTALDETFSAATAFVASKAADRAAVKASQEVQLQLYGLYKIATEGPCSAPQPSALKMTARAKWQAWQKLDAMPPEEAMQKYVDIVTGLYPSWAAGSTKKREKESSDASISGSKGPMGPVFSTFVYEEEPESDIKMDSIHLFAQEGDEENLIKCIDNGVPINLKDGEGRTPLHWAVDRGCMNITASLLNKNADVNAKDNEGQTALHYAAICERAAIAELLVKHGGDMETKDSEGNTPFDLCEVNWPWMQSIANASS